LASHPAYVDQRDAETPSGAFFKFASILLGSQSESSASYNTWSFDGHGAPGPIVHVREGQMVEMTLTNGGAIPHSFVSHAFAHVDLGQVGLLKVGNPKGTMSH
jgi:hypothetical protein